MAGRPASLRDVYLAAFNTRNIYRYAPGVGGNTGYQGVPNEGGYTQVWRTTLPSGNGIGMADDGTWLYCASWGAATIYRINMATGVLDSAWTINMGSLGINGGDMESMSLRTKRGRWSLIVGYADPASGPNGTVYWCEVDIRTRTLLQANNFVNNDRGCDWVWVINEDEFVTGTESNTFWRINIETKAETAYLTADGGVSYSIEVRRGRYIAVGGNSGPIQLGHTDTRGHNPVEEREIFVTPAPSTYFASTMEYDGNYVWFSSYSGDISGDTRVNETPVWRINSKTGTGKEEPLFYIPGSQDINGLYCPHRASLMIITGTIDGTGTRFETVNDVRDIAPS